MIIDVNVGYNLIEKVTVSCDSPDIAIDMTLGGDISIVQSDLAAHKIATNPHNITPAGIGALSAVEHNSSLVGDGTTGSPLAVVKSCPRCTIPVGEIQSGYIFDRALTAGLASIGISYNTSLIYIQPFMVDEDVTITDFWLRIVTPDAAGSMYIGLYEGASIFPETLLLQTEITLATAGIKSVPITETTLQANKWYQIAYIVNSSSVRFNSYEANQMPSLGIRSVDGTTCWYTTMFASYTYGALPADATTLTITLGYYSTIVIGMRKI